MTFRQIINARGTIPIWGTFCLLAAGIMTGQLIERGMLQELGYVHFSGHVLLADFAGAVGCAVLASISIRPVPVRA